MKSKVISLLASSTAIFSVASAADIPTLEERVSNLEKQGLFRFSGILVNRFDHIQTDGTKELSPYRIYAAINADAQVNDKLNFYSRFAMSKFMNSLTDQRSTSTGLGGTLNASRQELGPGLYVARAFLNYKILPSLSISIGRLPTNDGPPYHLYDDLARQGTYPMLAYSAQLDGAALTYNFNHALPENHKLALRGIFSPLTNNGEDDNNVARTPYLGGSLSATTSPTYRSTAPIWTVMADYENTKLSFAHKMSSIIQFTSVSKLQVGDTVARGTDLGALNTNGVPTSTGVTFHGSNLEFSYRNLTLYQEIDNIAETGISFAITFTRSMNKSSGLSEMNPLITTSGLAGTGFMTNSSLANNAGNAFLVTTTYSLPVAALNHSLIGLEYFRGSRYYQFFNTNMEDMTGLYNTRGNAYHAWYTQPLAEGLKWRIGYSLQKNNYSKGYLGEPAPSRFDDRTIYTQIRLDL